MPSLIIIKRVICASGIFNSPDSSTAVDGVDMPFIDIDSDIDGLFIRADRYLSTVYSKL